MRVQRNQVHVWCATLRDLTVSDLLESYRSVLSEEEAVKFPRFLFEGDRRQYLLSRALVRDVLSRYVGVEPSELVFTRNAHGKPALAVPAGCPITFNVSHTKGLSVCAVTCDHPIRVDVEALGRSIFHADVARRFFAPCFGVRG